MGNIRFKRFQFKKKRDLEVKLKITAHLASPLCMPLELNEVDRVFSHPQNTLCQIELRGISFIRNISPSPILTVLIYLNPTQFEKGKNSRKKNQTSTSSIFAAFYMYKIYPEMIFISPLSPLKSLSSLQLQPTNIINVPN